MKHESAQPNTSGDLCRRNFLQLLSLGSVCLGFGVSIFTRGYAMAEEADKETAHQLFMQGTKDLKGVRISEITPNDMFYWMIWRYEWKANQKGSFRLRVRATDKKGNIQESGGLPARSHPDGARGIHEIKISIT